MKRILLLLVLIFLSVLAYSQSVSFTGSVIDEDNKMSVYNAIVTVEGTTLAKTTNAMGEFTFSENIPTGEHIVTVFKDGYKVKYFLINIIQGNSVVKNEIGLALTNKERKKRKKTEKSLAREVEKREKAREAKITDAKKDKEKRDKQLAKEKKKLQKNNKTPDAGQNGAVITTGTAAGSSNTPVDAVSPIQTKYAHILGVTPEEITNISLYQFIDDWMGTPYLLGGANKEGIDCSSFSQRLFTNVYNQYIERTAKKQKESKYTDIFGGMDFLKEGDLLFFGDLETNEITHVGVYLGNNKFINSTSRKTNGVSGVKIDDLSDGFWRSIYCCAGRRINNN